jgi:hypothetical protein
LQGDKVSFMNALINDKKKQNGKISFIVPVDKSVRLITLENNQLEIVESIIDKC